METVMKNSLSENVRICIQSHQILLSAESGLTESDWMETTILGRYYYRGGKHYLIYEELLEGIDKPTSCRLKISADVMEMTRQGDVRVTLIFEEGQCCKSNYQTPYGVILLETETAHFHVSEEKESLEVEVEYTLSMDGQPVSENKMRILVNNDEAGKTGSLQC